MPSTEIVVKAPAPSGEAEIAEMANVLVNKGLSIPPDSPYAPRVFQVAKAFDRVDRIASKSILNARKSEVLNDFKTLGISALGIASDLYSEGKEGEGNAYLYYASKMAEAAHKVVTSEFFKEAITAVGPGAEIRDIYEAGTGKSIIDGHELENWERGAALFGIVTGGFGSKIFKAAKIAEKVASMGNMLKRVIRNNGAVEDGITIAVKEAKAISSIQRFGPLEKGPLHEIKSGAGTVSDTFRSGSYSRIVTEEEVTLYRVFDGKNAKVKGSYWSDVQPTGPLQATLDAAILPEWGSNASRWVKITLPKGSAIYRGAAAPQALKTAETGISTGQLLGGGNQVYLEREFLDNSWDALRSVEGEF